MDELAAENELLSDTYANAEKKKRSLYLDSFLAARSYAEAHFGTVGDWSGIKELGEHDASHQALSLKTFTHLRDLFGTLP